MSLTAPVPHAHVPRRMAPVRRGITQEWWARFLGLRTLLIFTDDKRAIELFDRRGGFKGVHAFHAAARDVFDVASYENQAVGLGRGGQ